jgi:hypothetical protein
MMLKFLRLSPCYVTESSRRLQKQTYILLIEGGSWQQRYYLRLDPLFLTSPPLSTPPHSPDSEFQYSSYP